MKILNAVEQEAFESPPVFNSVQRKQHFDFPLALRHLCQFSLMMRIAAGVSG
jgi:hypothetical protein